MKRRDMFGSLATLGPVLGASSAAQERTPMRQPTGDREPSKLLLGSWSLVSFQDALPSAEIVKPFGDSPMGLILYQADGHMSAQLSVGGPKRLVSEDPLRASAEEAVSAWQTYFGYWGTFEVYAERGVVVHRVEGCSFANWIGTEQVRHFRFDGTNRLILEAPSGSAHSTLIWQRRNQ